MSTEVKIGDNQYRIDSLDAIRQFHIARRLGPMLPKLVPLAIARRDMGENIVAILSSMEEPLKSLAGLEDADVNYIIHNCLTVVKRKIPQQEAWGPVVTSTGQLMFSDLSMIDMLEIVWKVLEINLKSFFSDPRWSSTAGDQAQ